MASSSGPLTLEVALRGYGVEVERPSAAAWASQCDWHLHCRRHGYPGPDADTSRYPPRPRHDGRAIERVTWKQIATWVRAATGTLAPTGDPAPGSQLSLFEDSTVSTSLAPVPQATTA